MWLRCVVVLTATAVTVAAPAASVQDASGQDAFGQEPTGHVDLPPVPPRVDTVEPAADGVRISPAVTVVEVASGTRTVDHAVVNGSEVPVTLTLEGAAARAGDDGAVYLPDESPPDQSPPDQSPPDGEDGAGGGQPQLIPSGGGIHLQPGERARLTSVISRPAGTGPGVVALRARGDGITLAALVAVRDGDSRSPDSQSPGLSLEVSPGADGVATRLGISAAGPSPVVVDLALRSRMWGRLATTERQLGPVVVLGGTTRTIAAEVTLPPLPGPVTVEAAAAPRPGGAVQRASVRRWLWPARATTAVAVVLVVLTAALAVRALRRRRPDLS